MEEYQDVSVEEIAKVLSGSMALDKLLVMLSEAETEDHKFGLDENGKAIIKKGLFINHSISKYFVSSEKIAAYFEKHKRPVGPMTMEEENAYLKKQIEAMRKQIQVSEKKETEVKAPAKVEEKVELTEPVAIPPRDEAIPAPENRVPTRVDLKTEFAKEIHEEKAPSEKAQESALKKAEEKKARREKLS